MKTTPAEREALIAAATTAHRKRDADGNLVDDPSWCDLDAAGRVEAFEATRLLRVLEAALDSEGLSSTGRAVLQRIRLK
jgi:hypothetical protein